jgi:RNA polymerase sigma-70 factor, ECF subfamily
LWVLTRRRVLDEQDAIQQLKAGNIKGLETLVNLYQVRAVRAAYLITQDRFLAEDVVQHTFLRIYRSIDRFDMRKPFSPYLLRSVVNRAVYVTKQQGRVVPFEDDNQEWDAVVASTDYSPENIMEANQLKESIQKALQALSPEQRASIVMRYYLDFSETEMAQTLKIPHGTIKWRLHAARNQLRGLLAQWIGEG